MIRSFNGKTPGIHPSAFISEAAYIIGDVEIGANSGVFPGAVIRGDFAKIKIGSDTMIEDNCVLHTGSPMEIGDCVIIGHGVVVHGRKIGHHNLIGNNATLLDNSEIGNFCLIAAGCLINQDMKVSDHSMVAGVPGRIKRQNPPDFGQYLEAGLESYRELLKKYKQQEI